MVRRTQTFFTNTQKSDIWDRWELGESMSSIGRLFERNSSSIYPLLSRTGGIRPPERTRPRLALTLAEREDISRGLNVELSLRAIARSLTRSSLIKVKQTYAASADVKAKCLVQWGVGALTAMRAFAEVAVDSNGCGLRRFQIIAL